MASSDTPTTAQLPAGFVPPGLKELQAMFPGLEILELIGSGGMGAVYKAKQSSLDRLVALKVLPREVVGRDVAFAERFAREARALARLAHPHIVCIYDFGQTTDGLYYFVMEYVDGPNLRHVMRSGELTPQQALAIVPQICAALQYAHDEGVVHRDIKPENILVDRRGRVKIADFGLAKLLAAGPGDGTLTQAGQVMGTWNYMAPEQLQQPEAVDHRADIYSLGVVFYEMLTGQLPLGRFEPPSQRADVDARLDQVVLRSLAREPQRRYQSARELKTSIETLEPLPISDSPPPLPPIVSEARHKPVEMTVDPLKGVNFSLWAKATTIFFIGWAVLLFLWNFGLVGLIIGLSLTTAGSLWPLVLFWKQSEVFCQLRSRRRLSFIGRGVGFVLTLWCTYLCFGLALFSTLHHLEAFGLPSVEELASAARRSPESILQAALQSADSADVVITSAEPRHSLFTIGFTVSQHGVRFRILPAGLTLFVLLLGIGCALDGSGYAVGIRGTTGKPKRKTWRSYYRPSLIAGTPALSAFPLACLALWILNLGLLVMLSPQDLQRSPNNGGTVGDEKFVVSASAVEFDEALKRWLDQEGYVVFEQVRLDLMGGKTGEEEVIGEVLFATIEPSAWGRRWRVTLLGLNPVQTMLGITAVSSHADQRTTVEVTISDNIRRTPWTRLTLLSFKNRMALNISKGSE